MKKKRLRELLRYDAKTGFFFNLKTEKATGKTDTDGYVYIWVDKNKYRADKLVWLYLTGEYPKQNIIHINGIKSDDCWNNLKKEKLIKPHKNSTSGVTGVYWNKINEKWRVHLFVYGKQQSFGSYESLDLAVMARYEAEQCHGISSGTTAEQYIKKMFM